MFCIIRCGIDSLDGNVAVLGAVANHVTEAAVDVAAAVELVTAANHVTDAVNGAKLVGVGPLTVAAVVVTVG